MKIGIANEQQKYTFFGMSFYFWKSRSKQSGAAEACWAHNREVHWSKLRSAKIFIYLNLNLTFNYYWFEMESMRK